jgi:hypothetical protein
MIESEVMKEFEDARDSVIGCLSRYIKEASDAGEKKIMISPQAEITRVECDDAGPVTTRYIYLYWSDDPDHPQGMVRTKWAEGYSSDGPEGGEEDLELWELSMDELYEIIRHLPEKDPDEEGK